MKTACVFLTILLLLLTHTSFSQDTRENKDKSAGRSSLSRLPEKMPVSISQLQSIFNYSQGDKVHLMLNDSFQVDGLVTERVVRNSGVISINIKSAQYPGVLFNFSRKKDAGQDIFQARILDPRTKDGLLLHKENSQYFLHQTPKEKLIAE